MKKAIVAACFICVLNVSFSYAFDVQNLEPIVVTQIIDGDTVQAVLINTKQNIRIRLADIDCPEKSKKSGNFKKQLQTWQMPEDELIEKGKQAKEKLKALIDLNAKDIYLEITPQKVCNPKSEKRTVGKLWTGEGLNVNEYMTQKVGCKLYTCPK